MRFVLDQGVPRDAAALLRGLGHECAHAGELGMCKTSDSEILVVALERAAVVVTLDAEFHTILALSRASGPSVVRIRMQGLGGPELVEWVQRVLVGFDADLRWGAPVTVKARKTTCHRLPVGSGE